MKNKKLLIIPIILCVIFLAIYINNRYTYKNKINYISKILELNLEDCKIEEDKDTHGGFLGDGEYFAKIICTNKQESEIKSKWNELPLSPELQEAMNIIRYDGNGGNNVYDKYNIPNIEDGYYCFVDRHSEAVLKDNKNDEDLNKRSSYNFTVGIYDSENKILYYYELDT